MVIFLHLFFNNKKSADFFSFSKKRLMHEMQLTMLTSFQYLTRSISGFVSITSKITLSVRLNELFNYCISCTVNLNIISKTPTGSEKSTQYFLTVLCKTYTVLLIHTYSKYVTVIQYSILLVTVYNLCEVEKCEGWNFDGITYCSDNCRVAKTTWWYL